MIVQCGNPFFIGQIESQKDIKKDDEGRMASGEGKNFYCLRLLLSDKKEIFWIVGGGMTEGNKERREVVGLRGKLREFLKS